ncbi:MAG TPA: hypothetical protein VIM11_18220 [Tepidisphaeraceae bacterium]
MMSHTLSIDEAAAKLTELVRAMRPGDEIVLTDADRPVARILPSSIPASERRPGRGKGMLVVVDDDDQHLDDFQGYMP